MRGRQRLAEFVFALFMPFQDFAGALNHAAGRPARRAIQSRKLLSALPGSTRRKKIISLGVSFTET